MNREGYNKHRKVIEAWAKGAKVECKTMKKGSSWYCQATPHWRNNLEYRIKPERKTITGWMNIYSKPRPPAVHTSKENADAAADPARVACVSVEIPYIEGEGLS